MPKQPAGTVATFFAGRPAARRIFDAVARMIASVGPTTRRVTRSQIAFRRQRGFAWAWTPDRWLAGTTAPLVLSIALARRDRSRRWKEVVEPSPGRFMHHLELWEPTDVDATLRGWLREAWQAAAPPSDASSAARAGRSPRAAPRRRARPAAG